MLPTDKRNVSNLEAAPLLYDGEFFANYKNNRFGLGVFSASDVLNYENNQNPLIMGYLRLRANVYIDKANILGDEARRPDGTELDEFDERSIHFVAFERRLGGAAVVASTRLIMKGDSGLLLPIEETFKDKLPYPIIDSGVEVSRFIINHSEAKQQAQLKAKMIMAELAYVMSNQFGPVVGMVEKHFRRSLELFKVPTDVLAGPLAVEEGGRNGEMPHTTELIAIKVLTDSVEKNFGKEAIKRMSVNVGEYTYWGDVIDNNNPS